MVQFFIVYNTDGSGALESSRRRPQRGGRGEHLGGSRGGHLPGAVASGSVRYVCTYLVCTALTCLIGCCGAVCRQRGGGRTGAEAGRGAVEAERAAAPAPGRQRAHLGGRQAHRRRRPAAARAADSLLLLLRNHGQWGLCSSEVSAIDVLWLKWSS